MHAASSRETGWRFKAKSFRLLLNDQSREAPACIYLFEQLYFPAMVRSARSAKLKETCPQESLFLELVRTADLLTRAPAQLLKTEDLSAAQYNILRILRGAPEGLLCGEIASRMVTRDPDITRLLDRMERRGLISRCRQDIDRRRIMVRLADPGRAILSRLNEPILQIHRQQLGHLAPARVKELTGLLEECRQHAAEPR
jgi:DNA-binding MarR family transcriptional regulator